MKTFFLFLALFLCHRAFALEGEFVTLFEGTIARSSWTPRNVYIYLPKGYSQRGTRRYPVLYMHDAQNLWDPARSTYGETWKVTEALNDLIDKKLIPPLIVVAVDNTNERTTEYTHERDEERATGGKAADYVDYLTFDLKRYIDHVYATKPTRDYTGIMGSSLGGLVSVFAATRYPEVWGLVGALSPAIWWTKYSILDHVRAAPLPERFYTDSGTAGGERPEDAKLLEKTYRDRGLKETKLVIDEGAEHNERFWAQRLPGALRFLYQGK